MTINILGTEYEVRKVAYQDDADIRARNLDGYCDNYTHLIVYLDLDTLERWDNEPEETKRECEKQTIRHEIVHAFLSESGLGESTHGSKHGWARDEEIVDWIATQGMKIYKAWQEAGAI